MKFYYINNSFCEGCDDCSLACPSGAVYSGGGKRYIIHDKCTSCGGCIRTCTHNAVSIESIDAMVQRMENADLYLSRIRRLEQEVAAVNEKLDAVENNFRTLVDTYPSALVIFDRKGRIVCSNARYDKISQALTPAPGTIPPGIALLTENGGAGAAETFEAGGTAYALTAVKLSGGNTLCTLDALTGGGAAAARIAEALDSAVVRQMETVRRIGTILGDETSLTLNDINRAIALLEAVGGGEK